MNEKAPGTGIATSLPVIVMSVRDILRPHLEVVVRLVASALTIAMVSGAHLDHRLAAQVG
jgi:hypothetical protein